MDEEKKVVDATDGDQHNKPARNRVVLSGGGLRYRSFADPEQYEAMLDSMERNEAEQKGTDNGSTTASQEGT